MPALFNIMCFANLEIEVLSQQANCTHTINLQNIVLEKTGLTGCFGLGTTYSFYICSYYVHTLCALHCIYTGLHQRVLVRMVICMTTVG